jgi:hypothetical protein
MSLNQKKTMPVFEKTCTNQSMISFSNPIIAPRQPSDDAKKVPFDYKKVNPMLIG